LKKFLLNNFHNKSHKKVYELKDHLGNVRVLVNDIKLSKVVTISGNSFPVNFTADITGFNNYYAFGMVEPARNFNSPDYRYGFNGQEKDDEIKGSGNSYDFGDRIQDPRIGGRFLSLDKFADKNPTFSPYVFADNNPIIYVDQGGNYRMSRRLQRQYPQLTNILKNLQQVTQNDPKTYEAFKQTLGITDDQANQILEWGKGPKIKVKRDLRYFGDRVDAITSSKRKVILDEEIVARLEGTESSKFSAIASVFKVFITLLHEGQHVAEKRFRPSLSEEKIKQYVEQYKPDDPAHESGLAFEVLAFGAVSSEVEENLEKYDFTKPLEEVAQSFSERVNEGKITISNTMRSVFKIFDRTFLGKLGADPSKIKTETK